MTIPQKIQALIDELRAESDRHESAILQLQAIQRQFPPEEIGISDSRSQISDADEFPGGAVSKITLEPDPAEQFPFYP